MAARAIMVQGTSSGAGKSLITAALCRIFRQDGYSAAPFKSQNMALNSYITTEGLEMGRAQVMQAQAAGIEPSALMNPILLKPSSDTGSQVIVNGEVVGNMSAAEYFRMKTSLIPKIMDAYNTLAARYDIIVLEGAGSPAEINLNADDIVNMGMAQLAKAPVLLVGDIDRGGVFASLAGTLMLLPPEQRAIVKATVINKFRGDRNILVPGLRMIEKITGVPVVGVVPYTPLSLDDEDSISDRLESGGLTTSLIDIAVIRLPRISNFTDFNPLEMIGGVSVRYVKSARELGSPDLIILPGTKSTMEDLLWLRECGLEAAVKKHAADDGATLGICGGYQMLGNTLSDPDGVEHGGTMRGMGLLPVDTVFCSEKTRTQVTGRFLPMSGVFAPLSGVGFKGYEIHMGRTTAAGADAQAAVELHAFVDALGGVSGGEAALDGSVSGNICGLYVHGLFDRGECARSLADALAKARGIELIESETFDLEAFRETQYDLLANTVRENVNIKEVYRILEEGI